MILNDLKHAKARRSNREGVPPLVVRSVADIDRIPLDHLVTAATVVDLSNRPQGSVVRRADLAGTGVADIRGCILCTGWLDERLAGGVGNPPVLEVGAAAYLLEGGVRTLAADFPIVSEAGDLLLHNNCVLVYCVSNVGELSGRIARLIALPLKQENTFSADARVIVIEE